MTCMDALMSRTHGCAGVTKVGRLMRETWGSKGTVGHERSEAPLKENRASKGNADNQARIKHTAKHTSKKSSHTRLLRI